MIRNLLKQKEYAKMLIGGNYNAALDPTKFSPEIIADIESAVRQLVGESMFADMIDKRNTVECNYREDSPFVALFPTFPDYEKLFDSFIYHSFSFQARAQLLIFGSIDIQNTGNVQLKHQGGQPAEVPVKNALLESCQASARNYRNRLADYLCANQSTYPLFDNKICKSADCGCGSSSQAMPSAAKQDKSLTLNPPSW